MTQQDVRSQAASQDLDPKKSALRPTTIRQVHDGFDRNEFSAVELTERFLASAKESQHGAYLTLCEERALRQAQAAQEILKKEGRVPRERFPLLGVALSVKDLISVDGVKTTCGSKILENYQSPYSATSIQRLEAAGAIILGKTNLDEFGMGGSNENSAYAPVIHPTHPDRVPGGSSGGSAVAVKAGLCIASLGTDTGGSIRLPASYCGIVGLKPSYGRISRFGQVAYGSSLDQIGPMTNSVEDAATLLAVMSGYDPKDSTSSLEPAFDGVKSLAGTFDWKGLRVGIPEEYFQKGLSSDVQKSVQFSLDWMASQGAKLVPVSLPHTQYAVAVYYLVAVSEASSNLSRFDGVRFGVRPPQSLNPRNLEDFYLQVRNLFGPEVKRRIILGTFALSSGYSEAYYKRACQVRRLIQQDFDQAFKKVDVIVGPVSPTTAYRVGERVSDPLQMYLNDIYTVPANLAGLPALSVPCGKDSDGLSVGLQFMAPRFAEGRILSTAHHFSTGFGEGRS